MYAEHETDSMKRALSETNRRRLIQQAYNEANGITPTTIVKKVRDLISISKRADKSIKDIEKDLESMSRQELEEVVKTVSRQMHTAAAELNFELAAKLRDKMVELKKQLLEL
jgi:excinuclease ABC subunit B